MFTNKSNGKMTAAKALKHSVSQGKGQTTLLFPFRETQQPREAQDLHIV